MNDDYTRVHVRLGGADPVAFDVSVHIASERTVSIDAEVSVDYLELSRPLKVPVLMDLDCEDEEQGTEASDVSAYFSGLVVSMGKTTSPALFQCVITLTPQAAVDPEVDVAWDVGSLVYWGDDDRKTDVDVTVDVSQR